jgi:hypothetical protein
VWREGYADWKLADESDTLVRAAAAAADEDEPTAAAYPSRSEDDVPTRMVQSSHVQPDYGHHAHAAGSYAPSQSRGVDYGMTGERNEDSVLFSARNIRQSIAPPPGSARAGYASGEGSGLIDIRSLAAMAQTQQQSSPPMAMSAARSMAPAARSMRPVAPMESTLALSTRSFGGLDTLAPVERRTPKRSKAVPIAIASGSAVIAAAAFLAVYATRGTREAEALAPTPPVVAATAAANPAPAPAVGAPAADPVAQPAEPEPNPELLAAVTPKTEPEAPAEVAEEPEEEAPEKAKAPSRSSRASKRSSARAAKRERAERVQEPEKEEPPAAPAKTAKAAKAAKAEAAEAEKESEDLDDLLLADKPASKADKPADKSSSPAGDDDPLLGAMDAPPAKEPPKNRSLDELLDGAVAAKKGSSAASKDSSLPETPTRDQVKAAMKGVEGDVRACGEGETLEASTITVALTVSGSTGRVTGARVNGNPGAAGSCIARAVRGATFPKFQKSEFSINFPFKLK